MKLPMTALCAAAQICALAAPNLIQNGDFETCTPTRFSVNYKYYKDGWTATGWSVTDADSTGLVRESLPKVYHHFEFDAVGDYSFFLQRRNGNTGKLGLSRTFTLPAKGIYSFSVDHFTWGIHGDYPALTVDAEIVSPGGETVSLGSFKPATYDYPDPYRYGFETPVVSPEGVNDGWTLEFSVTDTTTANYAYTVIDNVSLCLKTLVLEEDDTFSCSISALGPENVQIGGGATLTLAPAAEETVSGTVSFGTGSKLVFDMTGCAGNRYVLRTGGIAVPAGVDGASAFVELTGTGAEAFTVQFEDEGSTIAVFKDNAPNKASWTGGGSAENPADPSNWDCRNANGAVLGGVAPDENTVELELAAAADWRGKTAVAVSPEAVLDMKGHALKLSGLSAAQFAGAKITNTGALAELTVDVADGESVNNAIALDGAIRLAKTGAGTLTVSKAFQSYTGGTEIRAGVVKCGIDGYTYASNADTMLFGATNTIGNLVVNGGFGEGINAGSWHGATGWTCSPDNWVGPNSSDNYIASELKPQVGTYVLAVGCATSGSTASASQTIRLTEAGIYRWSFDYAAAQRNSSFGLDMTATLSNDRKTLRLFAGRPMRSRPFYKADGTVEIAEAGDWTLRFDFAYPAEGSGNWYGIIDNVVFARTYPVEAVGDGTLDMNGKKWLYQYCYVFNGGKLVNTGANLTGASTLGRVFIDTATEFVFGNSYAIMNPGNRRSDISLGGNTLTAKIADGKTFELRDVAMDEGGFTVPATAGTLWITKGINTDNGGGFGVAATNVAFDVGAALQVAEGATLDVGDFTYRNSGQTSAGAGAMNVFGKFALAGSACRPCTIRGAGEIDLSGYSGDLPLAGVAVADSAAAIRKTVRLGSGGNAVANCAKKDGLVIAWSAPPANVEFQLDETSAAIYKLVAANDGLRIVRKRGLVVIVR